MNVTCPSCGADMDLDVLLVHEDSRRSLAALVAISLPLGRLVLQYLRCFKPATRAMSHGRTVRLIEQLLPDLQRNVIEHKGREWHAATETWKLALERVLEQRDKGKLVLPLTSHDYLYAVISGMVDQHEGQLEREAESARRKPRSGAELQSFAAVLQPAAATAPIDYSQPSRHAQRVKAEAEARLRSRGALPAAGEEGGDGS